MGKRINWLERKRQYFTSPALSLTAFAREQGWNINGAFDTKVKGWREEKAKLNAEKQAEILNRIQETEIKKEVDIAEEHFAHWDVMRAIICQAITQDPQKHLYKEDGSIDHIALKNLCAVLNEVTRNQRHIKGLDAKEEKKNSGSTKLDKLIEAIKAEDNVYPN